jgi:hypothetical protein
VAELGFSIELNERFLLAMGEAIRRRQTWNQLVKDLRMSGISLEDQDPEPKTLQEMTHLLLPIIREVKSNKPLWDNLNYRVDLPQVFDLDAISVEEVIHLYLLRSFQKVWLREHYGSGASKDGGDSLEKHLKP